jgi:hypothetical protein
MKGVAPHAPHRNRGADQIFPRAPHRAAQRLRFKADTGITGSCIRWSSYGVGLSPQAPRCERPPGSCTSAGRAGSQNTYFNGGSKVAGNVTSIALPNQNFFVRVSKARGAFAFSDALAGITKQ